MMAITKKGKRQVTVTVYPSSLDDVNSIYESYTDLDKAFDSGSANNYARFHLIKGSQAQTFVYLNFDLSAIPDGATIVSVSAEGRMNMTGYQSTRWSDRGMWLASGTTQKSEKIYPTSLTEFSDVGTWTLAELKEAKMCWYVKRSGNSSYYNTDYYIYVYGGSITVTYEI